MVYFGFGSNSEVVLIPRMFRFLPHRRHSNLGNNHRRAKFLFPRNVVFVGLQDLLVSLEISTQGWIVARSNRLTVRCQALIS
jgi:hypothetical protein